MRYCAEQGVVRSNTEMTSNPTPGGELFFQLRVTVFVALLSVSLSFAVSRRCELSGLLRL